MNSKAMFGTEGREENIKDGDEGKNGRKKKIGTFLVGQWKKIYRYISWNLLKFHLDSLKFDRVKFAGYGCTYEIIYTRR